MQGQAERTGFFWGQCKCKYYSWIAYGELKFVILSLGEKTITQTCANDRVVKEHIARNHEFFYLQVSSKGSAPELQNLSRNVVMCVFLWKQFRNFLNVSQFIHAAPRQGPPAPRLQGVICSSCCCCCCCCVKIHAHFPHGCGTHFTVHTYFYTLAQGVKGCTRVESKLHVLTSGFECC